MIEGLKRPPVRGQARPTVSMPFRQIGLDADRSATGAVGDSPETRKKHHAVTVKLMPKANAMYSTAEAVVRNAFEGLLEKHNSRLEVFAVCAAEPSCPACVDPVTVVVGRLAMLPGAGKPVKIEVISNSRGRHWRPTPGVERLGSVPGPSGRLWGATTGGRSSTYFVPPRAKRMKRQVPTYCGFRIVRQRDCQAAGPAWAQS